MVSAYPAPLNTRLLVGFGVVGLSFLVALATAVGVEALSLAKFAFLLGGFALLIPTLVLKNPKAYWLFLLVFTIPFDITKWLSDPALTARLIKEYSAPASGTVSLEVYLTDVVLVAMLLPWLVRICLKQEKIYFPKIGYLFVCYLIWAIFVSIVNAESLILSMFEIYRQLMYFLMFIYLVNNLTTPQQIRSVVWAMFLAFSIGAGTVIVFFALGIGTDTVAFAALHDQPATNGSSHKIGGKGSDTVALSVDATGRVPLGSGGESSGLKRSQGMFRHPAIPASLCGLTLPIVLAYLISARNKRDRILFSMLYVWGLAALLVTFSRAGLIGFIVGLVVFLAVAGWSGLISRRLVRMGAVALAFAAVVSIPLVVVYLGTRPEAFFMRFTMAEAALHGYAQHPFLGVGLNNGTAAMKTGRQELKDMGVPVAPAESADSYYLAILIEVGPLGTVLFFLFFWKILAMAVGATRRAADDMKPLLVGIVAGLAALATQSLADEPMAGHGVSGALWLFSALIVVLSRDSQSANPFGARDVRRASVK